MDLKVRICYAFLETENIDSITPTSMRGFFGNVFRNDIEYHHHDNNLKIKSNESSFLYKYPYIQYKKVANRLLIIGLQKKSFDIPLELSKIDYIDTDVGKKIKINGIKFKTRLFDIVEKYMKYEFYTPWIALNSKNYNKFFSSHKSSRYEFFENILTGNLLSLFKGLNIRIDFRIKVTLYRIYPVIIHINDKQFIAFKAGFDTNVVIPEYVGIGKSVSKGFGTVRTVRYDS